MVVVLGEGMAGETSEGEVFKRLTPICSMRATAFFMATWCSCQSAFSRSCSVAKAEVEDFGYCFPTFRPNLAKGAKDHRGEMPPNSATSACVGVVFDSLCLFKVSIATRY